MEITATAAPPTAENEGGSIDRCVPEGAPGRSPRGPPGDSSRAGGAVCPLAYGASARETGWPTGEVGARPVGPANGRGTVPASAPEAGRPAPVTAIRAGERD